jgi:hypothetical protein
LPLPLPLPAISVARSRSSSTSGLATSVEALNARPIAVREMAASFTATPPSKEGGTPHTL